MAGDKHKKKTKGKKAAKRSAAKHKKSLEAGGDGSEGGGSAAVPSGKQRNPKAFTVTSRGRAKLQRARTAEKEQKRMHGASKLLFSGARRACPCSVCCITGCWLLQSSLCSCATVRSTGRPGTGLPRGQGSILGRCLGRRFARRGAGIWHSAKAVRGDAVPMVERAPEEPPPFVVLVQGPPGVGKSTLIRCLVKHCTRQSLSEVKGPVTVVAGKTRRLTFVECPQARQRPGERQSCELHTVALLAGWDLCRSAKPVMTSWSLACSAADLLHFAAGRAWLAWWTRPSTRTWCCCWWTALSASRWRPLSS